jgi:EAL domain-containing protein (putative c-di-GMP-specific phosphodiesterase class I)
VALGALADAPRLVVVAAGIETATPRDFLAVLGVRQDRGCHLAPPWSAEQFQA